MGLVVRWIQVLQGLVQKWGEDGAGDWQAGWFSIYGHAGPVLENQGEEGAEPKGKLHDYINPNITYGLELRAVAEMSFLHSASRLTLRDRVSSSDMKLTCTSFSLKWPNWGYSDIWLGYFPVDIFWACPIRRKSWGRPRTCRIYDISPLTYCIKPWDPSGRARGYSRLPCTACCHCDPDPDEQWKAEGWMDMCRLMY